MSNRDYRLLICALYALALVGTTTARLGVIGRACRMSNYRTRVLIQSAIEDGVLNSDMYFITSRNAYIVYPFFVVAHYRADIPAWLSEYEILAFNL